MNVSELRQSLIGKRGEQVVVIHHSDDDDLYDVIDTLFTTQNNETYFVIEADGF